ncbi:hypothetical protein C4D60_Mb07t17590 [Musa balbisiana]|uniref:Uncharacterized protein n=1 Tax=Musa balbisiana TaxID=52838 RepID=A0A4S8JH99_MUSBA|nr:hypothetical protein C4D60_Mb07t17590 [Musa balbisiana]
MEGEEGGTRQFVTPAFFELKLCFLFCNGFVNKNNTDCILDGEIDGKSRPNNHEGVGQASKHNHGLRMAVSS